MNRCGNKLNGGGYYKTLEGVNKRLAPGESLVKRYDNLDTPLLKDMKLAGGRSCKTQMKARNYNTKPSKKDMKVVEKLMKSMKQMKAGKYHMKAGKYHMKVVKKSMKPMKQMKAGKYHMKKGKKSMKKSMKKGKKSMKGGKFGCRQPVWNKVCQ